ncbi:MAG TPA: hypothetical protein DCD97_06435 [Firmicutes bacterium]|jgi:hypothetical protein|nr:hypothetical protein [Bacillota bacterium]
MLKMICDRQNTIQIFPVFTLNRSGYYGKNKEEIERKGGEIMQATRTGIKNIGKAEFMSLFHQYQGESLCSKKLSAYANMVQEPTLKNMINQMSSQCQDRANRLSSLLQEAGGSHLLS